MQAGVTPGGRLGWQARVAGSGEAQVYGWRASFSPRLRPTRMGTPAGDVKVRPFQPPGLTRGFCASARISFALLGASPAGCSSATFRLRLGLGLGLGLG